MLGTWAAVVTLLASAAAAGGAADRLRSGQRVERAIARGERHSYRLGAADGDVVVVRASARGASPDVTMAAGALAGGTSLRAQIESGYPPVILLGRMEGGGDLTLEVACSGGRRGRYVMEVESRAPTAADLDRLRARAALEEARRALGGGGDRLPAAVEGFAQAASLGRAQEDPRVELEALQGLATARRRGGDVEGANSAFAALLERARGKTPFEAEALAWRADAHLEAGELEAALPLLQTALRLARADGLRVLEARVLDGLGRFYNDVGDDRKSLGYRRQALQLFAREGRAGDEAALLQKIGIAHMHFGDLQESPARYRLALSHYQRALDLFVALGDRTGQAASLHHFGIVLRKLGRHRQALDRFRRSLELKKQVSGPVSQAQTLMGLCATYEALGDLDRAVEYGQQASALLRGRPSLLSLHWKVPASLARLERERGNLAQARSLLESAIERVEAAGTPLASEGVRNAWSAITDEVYDLYVDVLMRMHEAEPARGLDRAALEAAERGRARSLRELLREARVAIPYRLDEALVSEERRLREALGGLAGKQRNGDAAVERDLRALTTEYDALRARMRALDPEYAGLTGQAPLEASRLQALLEPGTALLEYQLGRPRSYVWVVTPDRVRSHVLAGEEAIEPLARELHRQLSARNRVRGPAAARRRAIARADAAMAQVAGRLASLLLGPVPDLSRFRRLIVVPDGVLHYVPFAALPAGGRGDGEPLLARHEVLHLPSAAAAQAQSEAARRPRAPRAAAVFADPVFHAGDPRVRARGAAPAGRAQAGGLRPAGTPSHGRRGVLPRLRYTRSLAEQVRKASPDALVALDFGVSFGAVTGGALDQFRTVLFATHGVLDSEYPELSGVALSMVDEEGRSRDGFLRLQDVYHLRLNAELVVLGACETGLGREVRGEGLVGLSRGFFYAGAARVLASLWKVDEQATVDLLRELYAAVETDGLSPPAALRRAQLKLRERPRYRSPYYWAAFVLQGGR